jgi:hypothetical protein
MEMNMESKYGNENLKASILNRGYVKVKVSRNRPGVAQKVPGCLGSQIS